MSNEYIFNQYKKIYPHLSDEEISTETHPFREQIICYYTWEDLITDEKKFTEKNDWFKELYALRKEYPEFDLPSIKNKSGQQKLKL